jgi:hypothetical protein
MGRRPEAEYTPRKVVVEAAEHEVGFGIECVWVEDAGGAEPGAMLAILALELAVEAGVMRRSLQDEHAEAIEHVADFGCRMLPSSVEPEHVRCAMVVEVTFEGLGYGRAVVALRAPETRAEWHRRVGRDEQVLGPVRGPDMHSVEATDDTRHGHMHPVGASDALALHVGERLSLDGERLTP